MSLPPAHAAVCDGRGETIGTTDRQHIYAHCYPGARGANNQTLLLLHGWTLSQAVFDPLIERLTGLADVITLDLRGHGGSSRPTTEDAFRERWVHAKDAQQVLAHFGQAGCVIPVGWSFGAIVASDIAVHLPTDRVCGLILVAGPPEAATARVRASFGPIFQELGALREGPRGPAERNAVSRFLTGTVGKQPLSAETLQRLNKIVLSLSPAERARVTSRPTYSNVGALNARKLPVLLIHGAKDPAMLPSLSIQIAEELELGTLEIYPDSGHWPFLEEPVRFMRSVEHFLNALEP